MEVLKTQQRQGTQTSASVLIPETATATTWLVVKDMTNVALADVDNVVRIHVYKSADDGVTWQYAGGGEWTGGSRNKDGSWSRPAVGFDAESLRGYRVRAELDVPASLRMGADVIYTEG